MPRCEKVSRVKSCKARKARYNETRAADKARRLSRIPQKRAKLGCADVAGAAFTLRMQVENPRRLATASLRRILPASKIITVASSWTIRWRQVSSLKDIVQGLTRRQEQMPIDIDALSEAELVDLNHRTNERRVLHQLHAHQSHAQIFDRRSCDVLRWARAYGRRGADPLQSQNL